MRWCRIRLVLLGLLLCVVHVVSGTCGQRFTDPASSAVLADVVIEGKVRKTSELPGVYNITVAVRKNIIKGSHLINKGRPVKTITLDKFKTGSKDDINCIGSVEKEKTYIFFLRDVADSKGLHFEIMAMPVSRTTKILSELKKVSCPKCAKAPSISNLSGQENVTSDNNVTLKCQVAGNPLPVFSWYKDGVLVKGNKKNTKSSVAMINLTQMIECEQQTLCLNGGTCMILPALSITFCQCPEMWAGRRCQLPNVFSIMDDYNRQASLMFERTLIIIGIVIAVLVFIVICIASYIMAKKARKQFEQRRNRREANRADLNCTDGSRADHNRSTVCVGNRNVPQIVPAEKRESEIRNENAESTQVVKQPQQIMLQDSSSPPINKPPHGHHTDLRQKQHSEVKMNLAEYRPEPRGRLAASSISDMELSPFIASGNGRKNKTSPVLPISENIEMMILPETTNKEDIQIDKHLDHESLNFRPNLPEDPLLTSSVQSPEPPSSLSLSPQANLSGTSPLLLGSSTTPSQTLPSSFNSPSQEQLQRSNDSSLSLNEHDTSVQPLLSNHIRNIPLHQSAQSPRPFESKSDKDLSRYLSLSNNKPHGNKSDIEDKKHLLRKLSGLSHSNTFPKSKENGLSDSISDSDEENALEVPYEKQLDLYISEDDLDLSKENLVSSSFSSVNTPSRQASHEERGIGLLSNSSISRPGIRKHQSEEGPTYKLVNKSHAYLQDSSRSRSLDNPPLRVNISSNPQHLNSTVAGSPDVETYDNMSQQPLQSHKNIYSYDPNDDSSPWEGEINKTDNHSIATVDERDRQNRLKDVVPDQQAIPI